MPTPVRRTDTDRPIPGVEALAASVQEGAALLTLMNAPAIVHAVPAPVNDRLAATEGAYDGGTASGRRVLPPILFEGRQ